MARRLVLAGAYRGYRYGGYRGYGNGLGAAAVGAAAVGAAATGPTTAAAAAAMPTAIGSVLATKSIDEDARDQAKLCGLRFVACVLGVTQR
jgi:hypothetical protein